MYIQESVIFSSPHPRFWSKLPVPQLADFFFFAFAPKETQPSSFPSPLFLFVRHGDENRKTLFSTFRRLNMTCPQAEVLIDARMCLQHATNTHTSYSHFSSSHYHPTSKPSEPRASTLPLRKTNGLGSQTRFRSRMFTASINLCAVCSKPICPSYQTPKPATRNRRSSLK